MSKSVRVWDLPTRLYHWVQFLLVLFALLSGFFAPEWWLDYHVWVGYSLFGLLVFRLIWGFLGSHYSRFSSFIFSPRRILEQARGLISGKTPHFLGHNPLGGLMIFGLIAVIGAILLTGLFVLGGEERQGPLAGFLTYAFGHGAKQIHMWLAILLVIMVALHVLGVIVESLKGGESLVRSMFTGRKLAPAGGEPPVMVSARGRLAVVIFLSVGTVILLAATLASRFPAKGMPELPVLAAYEDECTACHGLYHPSLLPRASWAQMMASLDDHFGEDASLDADTTATIAAYLDTYASEAWDTEAANRLREVDPASPMEIISSPFWKAKHAKISPEIFKNKPVFTKANCSACHGDAATGRFDDQKIAIPTPQIVTQ